MLESNFLGGLAECLRFLPGEIGGSFAGSSATFESPFVTDFHADFKLLHFYNGLVEFQIVGDTIACYFEWSPWKHKMARWNTLCKKHYQIMKT